MVLSFFPTNHLVIVKNQPHLLGRNWYIWEGTSHKLYQIRFVTFSKLYPKNSPPQSTTFVLQRVACLSVPCHLIPGYLPNLTSFIVSLFFLLQPYWPPVHCSAKQIPTTEFFTSFVTEPHGLLSLSLFLHIFSHRLPPQKGCLQTSHGNSNPTISPHSCSLHSTDIVYCFVWLL